MNKQIFRLFAFIAIVGFAFTSCQKEEAELVPQNDKVLQGEGITDIPFSNKKSANVQLSFNFMTGNITVIDGDITQEWVFRPTAKFYTRDDALSTFGSQIPTVEDIERLHFALSGSQYTIPQVLGLTAEGLLHYNPSTDTWPNIYTDSGYFWLADAANLPNTYWCGHMNSGGGFAIAHNQLVSKLQVVKIINR